MMFGSWFSSNEMSSYDQRRVLNEALDKLNTPKGWLVLAGSVAGIYLLTHKGILKMNGYDQRRTLEDIIDKLGGSN